MFTEEKRAERTMEALRSNRMDAYSVKTSEEAVELVKELIPEGSVCRVGGSRTLHETGITITVIPMPFPQKKLKPQEEKLSLRISSLQAQTQLPKTAKFTTLTVQEQGSLRLFTDRKT